MANSKKSPLLLPSRRTPPPIKRRDAARRGATRRDATRRGEGDELSSGDMARGSRRKGWARGAVAFAAVAAAVAVGRRYGWDGEAAVAAFRGRRDALGPWAAPAYVAAHALTLALCPPYAILFEGAAALLFGFLPGVACVFSAKVLGASLSFWIGRAIFRLFTSAMDWLKSNKYFHVVVKGVERDGWKFVLLARFSPLPSYIINYALSATDVGFFKDFLLPTVVGCLPMILQNVSIVSLAGAAVASTTGSEKSRIYSYLFPVLGIMSSILISWRIKQYSSALVIPEELKNSSTNGKANVDDKALSENTNSGETRKRR
uniref:VTT domain-containing protein n=2 Tax=Oryza TaxID=4527 RepID=A0A0E0BJV0_9ORYZ